MAKGNEGTTTPPAALTDSELRALAYFGVGLGSEGGDSGRNVSYQLSFAGNVRNGVMTPSGNSGYSIGTLQTDLGQHPEVAASLVQAYQTWAGRTHPDWLLTEAQQTQTARDLGRNGRTIKAQHGRPLDETVKSHLDTFLASDAGLTYVHERDTAQVNFLMRSDSGVNQLRETALYRGATLDEQAKLATIVLKLENQGGDRYYPTIIDGISNGTTTSVQDAQTVVNGFLPNHSGPSKTGPDYLETGVAHALEATDVFNALRNADTRSPLHQPWQNILANPLVNPLQTGQDAARPNLSAEYMTVRNLFLQKTNAPALIEALDQGRAYGYNVPDHQGRPRPQSTSLYASGDDFIVMDGNGAGKAYIGGAWSDVNRANLTRVNNRDGTVDLNINRNGTTEPLLHLDPNAPVLRPPQPTTGSVDQTAPAPAQAAPPPATGERERGDQRQGTVESGPTPPLPTDFRDRSHPGNAAFQRTLGEVYRMEDGQGIPHGPHSEKVAAALLADAERNKQGITNVEMRADGQVEGVARYNPFESEKRVSVNPQRVQSETMEAYAAQWSQARSPHYASNAPAAQRTPEQAQALELLSSADRQMFDKIRGATPAHISDDVVANALYAAKQDGIADASKVASVDMVGDRLVVNGTTPGFRGVVDVSQPSPPMQETAQQALAFNQQQAITQQQDEAQRQQRTQEASTRTA
jgi:hypothetical protein